MTETDKFRNRLSARMQIVVENVICGIKRCRIVKDTLRVSKEDISEMVMEIAGGLHNWRVAVRQPMRTVDITNPEELSYFK